MALHQWMAHYPTTGTVLSLKMLSEKSMAWMPVSKSEHHEGHDGPCSLTSLYWNLYVLAGPGNSAVFQGLHQLDKSPREKSVSAPYGVVVISYCIRRALQPTVPWASYIAAAQILDLDSLSTSSQSFYHQHCSHGSDTDGRQQQPRRRSDSHRKAR